MCLQTRSSLGSRSRGGGVVPEMALGPRVRSAQAGSQLAAASVWRLGSTGCWPDRERQPRQTEPARPRVWLGCWDSLLWAGPPCIPGLPLGPVCCMCAGVLCECGSPLAGALAGTRDRMGLPEHESAVFMLGFSRRRRADTMLAGWTCPSSRARVGPFILLPASSFLSWSLCSPVTPQL